MNELALFAGYGGGILGGCLLGWRTVCAVENDDAARQRLIARQDDGSLRPFPIWDDVRTFAGEPWAGRVDVVSGGFPCQDISLAGTGAGIAGERSGLWGEFARIIREVRPRYVLVENSPALVARGLGTVLGDLATLGFDARWGVLGAAHAGAPHKRERIWIVAYPSLSRRKDDGSIGNGSGVPMPCGSDQMANANGLRQLQPQGGQFDQRGWAGNGCSQSHAANTHSQHCTERRGWWSAEPAVGRVAHGVANRVDRLRGLGNGQVPAVVALAWDELIGPGQAPPPDAARGLARHQSGPSGHRPA